jgi:hypothetical protein
MPPFGAIKRRALVKALKRAGFEVPPAPAERCESNPTVSLMERCAAACGVELTVEIG